MTPRDALAAHLTLLYESIWPSQTVAMADGILANPKTHIEALVEAGVLEPWSNASGSPCYRAVQPHEHAYNKIVSFSSDRLGLGCICGNYVLVPNKLPISDPFA